MKSSRGQARQSERARGIARVLFVAASLLVLLPQLAALAAFAAEHRHAPRSLVRVERAAPGAAAESRVDPRLLEIAIEMSRSAPTAETSPKYARGLSSEALFNLERRRLLARALRVGFDAPRSPAGEGARAAASDASTHRTQNAPAPSRALRDLPRWRRLAARGALAPTGR